MSAAPNTDNVSLFGFENDMEGNCCFIAWLSTQTLIFDLNMQTIVKEGRKGFTFAEQIGAIKSKCMAACRNVE